MSPSQNTGHILTFYSFKGGVGRTMALANLAYFAAHNGMRVLMMDWDLEAPGLAYYFRGLLDPASVRDLKEAPGVLDLVWDWTAAVGRAQNENDLDAALNVLVTGDGFQECVRSVVDPAFIPEGATLDFIGAGKTEIATPEPCSYEEALARFSWSSFFDDNLGGIWVDQLRRWAKKNYDLILIDSRTGLADVAGICTMQMPDEVALCFVFNRQNIEGVSRVAAAIRTKRAEEVKVRAIPMRVARENTPEESDARARAIADLRRVGGFSGDSATKDLNLLAIPAADNVPFYETLAPFAAENLTTDILTFSYKKMTSALLGREINDPVLDNELVSLVRIRLQPRHATVEYVSKLLVAEPNRAIEELSRLIESAYHAEFDVGAVEDEYVTSLVNAAFSIEDPDYVLESLDLQSHALELLRVIAGYKPDLWRPMLVSTIERYITSMRLYSFEEDDAEMALLEELDALLSESPTVASRLQRITHRRRAAWLALNNENMEMASQTAGEVLSLANDLGRDSNHLSPDQLEELAAATVDMGLVLGDVYSEKEQIDTARREYAGALERLMQLESGFSKPELRRLGAELHTRLALLPSASDAPYSAANHALEAARLGSTTPTVVFQLTRLISIVLKGHESSEVLLSFCEALLGESNERPGRTVIANYYGRQPRRAIAFFPVLIELIQTLLRLDSKRVTDIINFISSTVELLLKGLLRRRQIINERTRKELLDHAHQTLDALVEASAPIDLTSSIRETMKALSSGVRRVNRTQDGDVV